MKKTFILIATLVALTQATHSFALADDQSAQTIMEEMLKQMPQKETPAATEPQAEDTKKENAIFWHSLAVGISAGIVGRLSTEIINKAIENKFPEIIQQGQSDWQQLGIAERIICMGVGKSIEFFIASIPMNLWVNACHNNNEVKADHESAQNFALLTYFLSSIVI